MSPLSIYLSVFKSHFVIVTVVDISGVMPPPQAGQDYIGNAQGSIQHNSATYKELIKLVGSHLGQFI